MPPRPHNSATTDDDSHREWNPLRTFSDDTRGGAATQIDFANGMVILLGGILFYFAVTSLFLGTITTEGPGDQATTYRVSNHLVGDIFLTNASSQTADAGCIHAYFTKTSPNSSGCNHDPAWGDTTDDDYLQQSLSLTDTQSAHIEFRDSTGTAVFELGQDSLPDGNIGKYHRRVVTDMNTDGTPEWYTVVVYIW